MRRDLTLAAVLLGVLITLYPAYSRVFADADWQASLLGAGTAAILLAAAVRRLRGGVVVAAAVSFVGLAVWLYVSHLPHVGLLPDATSWADATALLREGILDLRDRPAPTQTVPGIAILLSTGTWAMLHLSHEIAIRWRRVGLALLPLVVLWVVPLAVPLPESAAWPRALPFLAMSGLLLLLGADDDVEQDAEDPAPRVTTTGLAVGASALAFAVLFPWVLPGYGADAWTNLTRAPEPRGYQPIVDVSQRLQLPEERDVLRVVAPTRTYLRLAGLDSFDGFTWRLGPPGEGSYQPDSEALHRTDRELPPEEPATVASPLLVDVEVLELDNIYVPTPYQPVRVLGPNRQEMIWSTEGGFLATWDVDDADSLDGTLRVGVRQGFNYRVEAARPTPNIEQLRQASVDDATRERWTQLPRDYPRLGELAQQVYAAAGAQTDVDRALALQNWFAATGGFDYSLDVPALRGDDALERFIVEDRVGYCEYFATGMAVMLRQSGIPARVAVGFLPGRITQLADPEAGRDRTEFTVSTRDAHAWVEVLFPGYGWITFEPTPRDDSTQLLPREDDLTPIENERERAQREQREQANELEVDPVTPELDPAPPEAIDPFPEETLPGDGSATEDPGIAAWQIVLVVIVLLVGLLLLLGRQRARHAPHGAPPATRVLYAQRNLLDTAERVGVGRRPAETAVEVVARWRHEGRIDTRGHEFATIAQAAAFGGDVDGAVAQEAEQLVADLEDLLRRSVPPRDRLLAPIRRPLTAARDLAVRTKMLLIRLWDG